MSEENIVDNNILSDQAVNCIDEDLFDFKNHALNLASILAGRSAKPGTVVGVSGTWGSGKSSVLNLVKCILKGETSKTNLDFNKEIAELIDNDRLPIIFEFDPWLINNKDEMIKRFFNGLISTIQYSQNKNAGKLTWAILSILQCFQSGAKSITDLLSSIEIPIPIGPSVATFKPATITENWGKEIENSIHSIQCDNKYSYDTLKKELITEMSSDNKHVVIFIDDMDRLLGDEAMSVLKLIRMITDIPFFNCIIAYDEVQTSKAIDQFCAGNGREYIRKMINVHTYVPEIDSYMVDRYLKDNLLGIFHIDNLHYVEDEIEIETRLGKIYKIIISLLSNQRQMKIFINAFLSQYSNIINNLSIEDAFCLCALHQYCPMVFISFKHRIWPFSTFMFGFEMITLTEHIFKNENEILNAYGVKDNKYFEMYQRLIEEPCQPNLSPPPKLYINTYVGMFGNYWNEGRRLLDFILINDSDKSAKMIINWKYYFGYNKD